MVGAVRRPAIPIGSFVALLLAVAGAATPLTPLHQPLEPHPLEAPILVAVNVARERAGLSALRLGDPLAAAARQHARTRAQLGAYDVRSPIPEEEWPNQRVGNAGGAHVRVGETHAWIEAGATDPVAQVLDRLTTGPTARAHVLNDLWTHVGIGVHEADDGAVLVVVVLTDDPNPLLAIDVTPLTAPGPRLVVRVRTHAPGAVALAVDERTGRPMVVGAGATIELAAGVVDAVVPTEIRLLWEEPRSAAMVEQDRATFDPVTGLLQSAGADDGARARIDELVVAEVPPSAARVVLTFERDAVDVSVHVDGTRGVPVQIAGRTVELVVPLLEDPVQVVVALWLGGGRHRHVHAFELRVHGPRLAVVPLGGGAGSGE